MTFKERQALDRVQLGKSNKEIAQEFNISESAVKHRLCCVYRKLGITSAGRSHLAFEYQKKLMQLDQKIAQLEHRIAYLEGKLRKKLREPFQRPDSRR